MHANSVYSKKRSMEPGFNFADLFLTLCSFHKLDFTSRPAVVRKKGITVLIVEQNARLSLSRSDRGYIFSNGKVVHTAPASEILVDPQINEYFLGTKKDE